MSERLSFRENWKIYWRLQGFMKPYVLILIVGIVTNILFSMLDYVLVQGLGRVFDEGFIAKEADFLSKLPFYLVLFAVLRAALSFASEYAMGFIGRAVMQDVRQKVFEKYLRLPTQYFDENSTGDMISRLNFSVERVGATISESMRDLLREGAAVVSAAYLIFSHSLQLGLVFFIGGPLIAWVLGKASKRFRKISRDLLPAMGLVTQASTQSVQGIRTIRVFGAEKQESEAFWRAQDSSRRQQMKLIVAKSVSVMAVYVVAGLALAGVVAFAADALLAGSMSPGDFVVAFSAMATFPKPLRALNTVNANLQAGLAAAEDVFRVLDLPDEVDEGTRPIARARGELQIRDLQFSYPGEERPVLAAFNLDIPSGHTVALVGRSGSGKTTLASLLMRLYTPVQGHIVLDGEAVTAFKLADYRRQFAVVSQNVTLFNDSVRNNIAYGCMAGADDAAIRHAAEVAQAWSFIASLPQGLDTVIGENGSLLSGGQRQRIAIARALLKNAPILILDEATSALDNESEHLIQKALENLMRDRTVLVIAHRLSTIERADAIVVIDQGQVVERGTHAELLALQGEYARLHARQFSDDPAA